jgi:threonine dehydrogenase-like Zn-dependent dehydrogenase
LGINSLLLLFNIPFENGGHVVVFSGGIIGVLNALAAKARGAKEVTINAG